MENTTRISDLPENITMQMPNVFSQGGIPSMDGIPPCENVFGICMVMFSGKSEILVVFSI